MRSRLMDKTVTSGNRRPARKTQSTPIHAPWGSARIDVLGCRARQICRLFALVLIVLLACGTSFAVQAGQHPVVINEIMYHPAANRDELQYVELFNAGPGEVNLSGWAFTKGIKFGFPEGTTLAPQSYLVVCSNVTALTKAYGLIRALGPFTGRLSHKQDHIELTDAAGQITESVRYADQEPWARGADGYSSSLERICPSAAGEKAENWAASTWPASRGPAGTPGRQNDSYSAVLPPVIDKVAFVPTCPRPEQQVKVSATVADEHGLKAVALLYRVATSTGESQEQTVPMTRSSGDEKSGVYEGLIQGQAQGQLLRFRILARNSLGAERFQPSPTEPRPSYSYFTFAREPASIPQGYALTVGRMERGPARYERNPARRPGSASGLRGTGAFLYLPPEGGDPVTFDHVHLRTRSGGYKIHFQKDRPLKGMSGVNLILEGPLRWILSEPLADALYRMAGVPAPLTEHVRLTVNGRSLGLHLLVEQPNKSFLARNGRDSSGNLYKLIWYGEGIVGQHEKKTNPGTGHGDIVQLVTDLRRTSGAEQWAFIERNFNVEECVNYYAVNMCIQNWDGFFNNYYAFHDTAGTGKWEIYPWDEDKTWGDYDGASPRYDWYEMPLTYGMNGDNSSRNSRQFGGGPFGGVSWWRPPGCFSGPLLANPEFRKRFLARLREICETLFTEESFYPILDAMQKRLEPEVRLRAKFVREDARQAERQFAADMQSFRNQVQHRRKFILTQLTKAR
jgi:hypothetical protein